MTTHELNIVLQIVCVTLLALAGIYFFVMRKRDLTHGPAFSLVTAVICYLVLDTPFIQERKVLFLLAATGAISIPVIFFLLTKAIFDDHFKATGLIAVWFGIEIAIHYWVYLKRHFGNHCEGRTSLLYIIRNRFNRIRPGGNLYGNQNKKG
jgi:hypothetical protein